MPRVIAGTARGTRLEAPEGQLTRPTSDRVKEALFSILSLQIPGARFLDLFAGSGQIGIEAASRGAQTVILAEENRASLGCLRKNIEKTRLEGLRVMAGDVYASLSALDRNGEAPFNLVYLDPPYRMAGQAIEKVARLVTPRLLAPGAFVVLEHAAAEPAPAFVTDMQLVRNCKYGIAMLSFYKENHDDRGSSI
ncbi:MAG: 16S rRNA (guanine(966)-N(2))-methyltransferase RsmD [Clostridiaceae bacterium]|nr:16S rRNA (guanine(966)-N(2))-methyltransferase RsmD [Clostridiaceae bacterium]